MKSFLELAKIEAEMRMIKRYGPDWAKTTRMVDSITRNTEWANFFQKALVGYDFDEIDDEGLVR